ncbi:unnamed protein product [marine sediment metagenome]|uniref:Uncharacterized protein n=1 Tax=marine sediment metagenome TaxID=412755 RepID=X1CMR0_9ZZZZ
MIIVAQLKRLYDATDNLIKQQFYKSGSDTIIGRTPEVSIKIKNSGQIIKKYKNLFNQNMRFFLEGDYMKFFTPFKIIKGVDENHISEIYQDIQIKLAAMHGTEFNVVLMYTIVVSSLTTSIRDIQFNESIQDITVRTKKKASTITDKQIQKELEKLFMRNDKNISILYNISYLYALAESFNFMKTARICKIQRSKYINRIVTNLRK